MKKIICAVLSLAMAAQLLAVPAVAQTVSTPETAATTWLPEDITAAEKEYAHIGLYEQDPEQPDEAALDTFALDSYNTSNAAAVYSFLTGQCGMNAAQAAGVMGSIYTESRFNPAATNPNDTGGTTSYGLCQWNSARFDALRDWCAANGYDYTTLDGQLHYLQYEITSTWEKRIWTVTDSEGRCFGTAADSRDGAWTAGYTWARYYERGWSGYWSSRGDYAQEFYDAYATPAPTVDVAQVTAFVTRLYSVCLGRTPDAAGLADWVSQLTSRSKTGVQVACGFVFSDEFKAKNYCNTDYIKQLYRAFMGREYEEAGLQYWLAQMQNGSKREDVFNGFALSTEFSNICTSYGITQGGAVAVPDYGTVPTGSCSACGAQDGVTGFVTRLYAACLDRAPDATGLAYWTSHLWDHTESGKSTAYGFIFSNEFVAKNTSNSEYLDYLYKAFMDRGADTAGKAYWSARLAAGASREEIFNGFVASDEFTAICAGYGITRG